MSGRHPSRFLTAHVGGAALLVFLTTHQVYAQRAAAPAPVPPEVAIVRPLAAELEQVETSLKKFLAGADPATKAILEKYPDLVAVRPPAVNSAIVPAMAPFFRAKHEANVELAKKGGIDVLFMGDSITDFWRNTSGNFAGKPVFDKHFGDMKVANFGIAGDTTQGVLYRLQNGEGQGFSPKAVMLMIGTNNTGRNGAEIAEGIGAVTLEMKKDFPEAKILLLAVFPRGTPDNPARATIAEINKAIAKLHDGKRVFYLDIGPKFLDADGNIPRDVMSDTLHPSAKGYEIWAEAVKEPLANLLKPAPEANKPAQEAKAPEPAPQPVTLTTQEDHRNMQAQLGITRLRPGPSGNESAPNHANYDESLANPFPKLPEVLRLNKGTPVTTPEQWWNERRPEIVEDFEREVVGRLPANVPKVTWAVLEKTETTVGEIPVVEKRLQGKVDNSACPSIEVNIAMTLVTPKNADGPVPVLMMYGGFGFGPGPARGAPPAGKAGAQPPAAAPGGQPPAVGQPPAAGKAGGQPPAGRGRGGFGFGGQSRQQILAAKWGYATISPASIQADNGAGLTRGIIGLTNLGQPRKPDDWGSLRAWGWGAARGLDYLETDPAVDARRVGIEGVSRYGKAALVAMAFEPRFAMVLVGSSGEGGAKLHRRNFGEAVENLTGQGEYHWMAGNFLKYGAAEASFGSKNAGDIPVDAHQLIALCAPRLTFISYGVPERGDAKWLDQQGSFMAAIAAGPVFRLLGAKDLGRSDDYLKEKMPTVNEGLLDGALAWRQHDGGHTDGPNIEHFLAWANKQFANR